MVFLLGHGVAKAAASSPLSRCISRPVLSAAVLPSTRDPGWTVKSNRSSPLQLRALLRRSGPLRCPPADSLSALTGSSESTVALPPPLPQLCFQSPHNRSVSAFHVCKPECGRKHACPAREGSFCHRYIPHNVSGASRSTAAFRGVRVATPAVVFASSQGERYSWLVHFRSLYSSNSAGVPLFNRESASQCEFPPSNVNGLLSASIDLPHGSHYPVRALTSTSGGSPLSLSSVGDTTSSSLFSSLLCYLLFLTATTTKFFTFVGDRRHPVSCEEDKSKPDDPVKVSPSSASHLVSRRLFGSWFPLIVPPSESKDQASSSGPSTPPADQGVVALKSVDPLPEASSSSSISSAPDVSTLPSRRVVGSTEGRGGLMRWGGGGVGRWSEAANAPIEDRSFAVFLSLQGDHAPSQSCLQDERECMGFGGEGEKLASTDLERAAALVFRDEISGVLGREIEAPRFPAARRKLMKERHAKTDLKVKKQKVLLAAVIDGHGGPQVAEYVMQNLPWYVEHELRKARRELGISDETSSTDWMTEEVLGVVLTRAFRALDEEIYHSVSSAYRLGLHRSIRVGACCTAVLVTDTLLVVANSGDCKAILSRRHGAEVQPLNAQLNANCPVERQRLREEHPNEDNVVVCKHSWEEQRKPSSVVDIPLYYAGLLGTSTAYSGCYVKGRLQPTRAFGDFLLKKSEYSHELQRGRRSNGSSSHPLSYPYLTVDPVVQHFELRGDEDFVVLASDGVWDFLNDREAAHVVSASLQRSRQRAASAITGATSLPTSAPANTASDDDAVGSVIPAGSSSSNKRGSPAVFAAEAARLAATELVKAVLQKAAEERAMSVEEMKAQEPKQRRRCYDDTTAVVLLIGQEWKTRPIKDRR